MESFTVWCKERARESRARSVLQVIHISNYLVFFIQEPPYDMCAIFRFTARCVCAAFKDLGADRGAVGVCIHL